MSAELVTIPFHGTDLLAVDDSNGKPLIVLRPALDSLGVAFDSQRRKLNSRSWACVTQRVLQIRRKPMALFARSPSDTVIYWRIRHQFVL